MFDWGRTLYDRYAARKPNCCSQCLGHRYRYANFGKSQARTLSRARIAECLSGRTYPFFDAIEKNQFQIKTEIKRRVHFKQHDLLKDPYNGPFDVIVCRNVTIYFKSDARDAVYQKFSDALVPGAFCLRERQKRSISRNNSVSRKSIRLSIKKYNFVKEGPIWMTIVSIVPFSLKKQTII